MEIIDKIATKFMVITVIAIIYAIILSIGICAAEYYLANEIDFNGNMVAYSLITGYVIGFCIYVIDWIRNVTRRKKR